MSVATQSMIEAPEAEAPDLGESPVILSDLEDLERHLATARTRVSPVARPELESGPSPRELRILTRLLALADTYRAGGSLRQAISMYLELVQDHPDTPQAQRAEDRLLEIARDYEEAGELRSARSLYEILI
ncbi:MAG TPA: tetratricopeptide repeat protein [Isosphaeraceae bacterium]